MCGRLKADATLGAHLHLTAAPRIHPQKKNQPAPSSSRRAAGALLPHPDPPQKIVPIYFLTGRLMKAYRSSSVGPPQKPDGDRIV